MAYTLKAGDIALMLGGGLEKADFREAVSGSMRVLS